MTADLLSRGGKDHIKVGCTEDTEFRAKPIPACVALMDKSEENPNFKLQYKHSG